MDTLALAELKIENFREIESLHLPNLSRINLVTGKNGVGKVKLAGLRLLRLAPASAPLRRSPTLDRNTVAT
jgi:predicted ATPase